MFFLSRPVRNALQQKEEIMNVGVRVKERREALGLSQRQLADRCGVSSPMICWIERGTKQPSLQLGYILAEVLETTVSWLLGINEETI